MPGWWGPFAATWSWAAQRPTPAPWRCLHPLQSGCGSTPLSKGRWPIHTRVRRIHCTTQIPGEGTLSRRQGLRGRGEREEGSVTAAGHSHELPVLQRPNKHLSNEERGRRVPRLAALSPVFCSWKGTACVPRFHILQRWVCLHEFSGILVNSLTPVPDSLPRQGQQPAASSSRASGWKLRTQGFNRLQHLLQHQLQGWPLGLNADDAGRGRALQAIPGFGTKHSEKK